MTRKKTAQYRILEWCVFAIVSLSASFPASAQTVSASIQGSVLDSSGAVVPRAKIVVERPATNETHILTTSESGSFSLPGLLPGTYRVTVEARGFKTVVQDCLVEVGRVTTLDTSLSVGDMNQVVEVQATTVQVNRVQTCRPQEKTNESG